MESLGRLLPYEMYEERGWNVIMLFMCMCKCVSVIVSVSNYVCVHMHTCVHVDGYEEV